MIFNFDNFNIVDIVCASFEIESNGSITMHNMEAPQIVIQNQFINLVQQAANLSQPCRIKLSRIVSIQDTINHTTKNIEHFLEFKNNAYLNNE